MRFVSMKGLHCDLYQPTMNLLYDFIFFFIGSKRMSVAITCGSGAF